MNVIVIASQKGGVGKTTFAVNLSIAQRKFTDQVFLLDTDMGMANSHVLLGVNPKYSISDVISGEKKISEKNIPDWLSKSIPDENKFFISGELPIIRSKYRTMPS